MIAEAEGKDEKGCSVPLIELETCAVGLARHGSVLAVVVRGQTWTRSFGTGLSQLLWLLAASSPSILHTFLDVPRVQLVYCQQHCLRHSSVTGMQ
ncbi:hypothetical protein AOLI_G00316640 [Acnodon oligacanthus]